MTRTSSTGWRPRWNCCSTSSLWRSPSGVAAAPARAPGGRGSRLGRAGRVPQVFAAFAIWWAWMNFTWFASAYDTDDVAYRLLTLLQMVGVLVLALGIPLFSSPSNGGRVDNVLDGGRLCGDANRVGGAVVTRCRCSDPPRRRACLTSSVRGCGRPIGMGGADLRPCRPR